MSRVTNPQSRPHRDVRQKMVIKTEWNKLVGDPGGGDGGGQEPGTTSPATGITINACPTNKPTIPTVFCAPRVIKSTNPGTTDDGGRPADN